MNLHETVILVDHDDNEIGLEEKMKAHKDAVLHRAFSIFIFNKKDELLLQQRADGKYHSGGLWTNTCCSHPRQGETIYQAAHRRLQEEMGFDTELKEIFSFTYKAELDNELSEYEFDHVLVGRYDNTFSFNRNEVQSIKWIDINKLREDIDIHPEKYTVWFKIAFKELLDRHDTVIKSL